MQIAMKVRLKNSACKSALTLGLLLLSAMSVSQAATVSLNPITDSAPAGDQVSYDLIANFGAVPTLGGAIDLVWDPAIITFQSFAFDVGFGAPPRDAGFDIMDLQSSSLFSLGFGNFGGITLNSDTV